MLFIGVMTYAASVDSDQYVRTGQFQLGEFTVSLSGNATQTARHGAAEVQLDNPLTREVEDEMCIRDRLKDKLLKEIANKDV